MAILKKIFFLLFLLLASHARGDENILANSEAGFSFANGTFSHQSTAVKGTSSSMLGPDLTFNYYLKPTQAILSGLDLHLNFSGGEVGLIGLRVGYKWYYWGQGYYQISNSAMMTNNTKQRFSSYVGTLFKRYTYFLSNSFETAGNFESSGNFYNIDLLVGADYMLGHQIKATSSLSLTFMSLAATDTRIKMASKLFTFGLSYLF
jgi:hypothetical protein